MTFNFDNIIQLFPVLLQGTLVTLYATIAGMFVALILGLALAIFRRTGPKPAVIIIDLFILVIRSTPLLIQLYLLFYVLPLYGPTFSPLATGIFALGLHYSCFISEVLRAGIEAIPKGHWEAAIALQFSRSTTWRRIIIPQVFSIILPQIGNYLLSMYKHAALLATITVVELLGSAMNYAGETFRYFEAFTMVGIIYFAIGYSCSLGIKYLEARRAF